MVRELPIWITVGAIYFAILAILGGGIFFWVLSNQGYSEYTGFYHDHSSAGLVSVRHSYLVPHQEVERWVPVARDIWEDLVRENPSLRGRGFTLSLVSAEELGGFTGRVKSGYLVITPIVSVALLQDGQSREEREIVETIAHELDHLRWFFLKGSLEGCYTVAAWEKPADTDLLAYLGNPCEASARAFGEGYADRYLELWPWLGK